MTARSAPTPSSAPGGDAAVVRVHGTKKALAITTDCTPRYCYADPYRGREAGDRRGLSQPLRGRREAAGDHQLPQLRQPAAARDHGPVRRLPRRHGRSLPRARLPDRERQRLALQREQGDAAAAARSCPRRRSAASACSRIGRRAATIGFKAEGETSDPDRPYATGHVGQSLWLRDLPRPREGPPPPVDLAVERRAGELRPRS